MRHRHVASLALVAALAAAPAAARAAEPAFELMGEATLPGGVDAARALLRDRTAPSRALFLAELIRRFYDTPRDSDENQQPLLQALLAHLDRASRDPAAPSDAVPLPLGAAWWSGRVFGGRVTPPSLVLEILRSRDAALLYCGLLALDRPTRAWLGGEPALVARLARSDAALLLVAGPGVRVADGRFAVPGGDAARAAWEHLVGARTAEPAAFLGRVLDEDEGVLAYFLGRMALVPAGAFEAALSTPPDASDADRARSLARLYRVFKRAAEGWRIGARPFSSLPDDPTLLLTDVHGEIARGARVPGSQRFWSAVFEASDASAVPAFDGTEEARAPASVLWLLEQAARPPGVEGRVRAAQVRFGLRVFGRPEAGALRDRATALAALGSYPALVRTLERMHVTTAAAYGAAIDRAASLRAIGDDAAQARSTAEFQGALALVARAVARCVIPRAQAAELVSSLAAVPPLASGAYGDGISRWVEARLRPLAGPRTDPSGAQVAAGAIDDDLAALISAMPTVAPSTVEWEGARYRVDLAFGDARRVERVRGDRPPRLLEGAAAIFAMADRVGREPFTRDTARREVTTLAAALRDARAPDDGAAAWPDPRGSVAVRRLDAAAKGERVARADVAAALSGLAEDLTAQGLAELAYAAGLGGSELLPLSSSEAASRHDLGVVRVGEARGALAWRMPVTSVRARGAWHIEGSLLALDLALAETWLRRTSDRPLETPPTVDRGDRRAMGEVVVTMDPSALRDADLVRIVDAIVSGRRQVAALASPEEAERTLAALPVGGVRRSVLPWMLAHEPERFRAAFSPSELMRLGAGAAPDTGALDAWGAPVRPRQGCVCLEFPSREPDLYKGFLSSGVLPGTVPDLNLRMAERLRDLRMPAALLPGVLAAATLTLVDRAPSRFPDDLRALVEQVNRVSIDDAEQYLSLLTVDGPLVPLDEGARHESGGRER
jgi:hypothetical protein